MCILSIQTRCPPWHTLEVIHLYREWGQKLSIKICRVNAVSESEDSSVFILHSSMCREDKSHNWFLRYEPTKQKSWLAFPQPGENTRHFTTRWWLKSEEIKDVPVLLWWNEGSQVHGVAMSRVYSESWQWQLFIGVSCRNVVCKVPIWHQRVGVQSQIQTVLVHAWPSNSDTDSPSGSEPSSTSCTTAETHGHQAQLNA